MLEVTIYNFNCLKIWRCSVTYKPLRKILDFILIKYWIPDFSLNKEGTNWPDIQLLFSSAGDNTDGGLFGRRNNGLTDEYYSTVFEPIVYRDAFSIAVLLLRPKSRGKILLKDNHPHSHPLIYPNYLKDPHDVCTLVSLSLWHYIFIKCYSEIYCTNNNLWLPY